MEINMNKKFPSIQKQDLRVSNDRCVLCGEKTQIIKGYNILFCSSLCRKDYFNIKVTSLNDNIQKNSVLVCDEWDTIPLSIKFKNYIMY